ATGRSGEPSGTAATPVLLGERDLPGQKPTKPASRIPFLRSPRFLVSFSALAAVLLLALALWQRQRVVPTGPQSLPEALDSTVAVLLQAHGAEWEETGMPTRTGAALPPGLLRLKSGFAHLEFYSGATVILEGPAEFHLISRMRAYCTSGKLRATVPTHAQGFTIDSPQLHLVDRGTEFGLHIGAGGKTEVDVFQGEGELHAPAGGQSPPHTTLKTGQGVRLDGPGEVRPIRPDPDGFQTAQGLAQRSEEAMRRRHLDWLVFDEALRRDPDLLVYYPF